jgi:beta-barrel assembly-enhancing protease
MIIDRVLLAATDSLFTRELGRAGRLAFSVDFEREADYVGAYYAARAGYDLVGRGNSGERIPWRFPTAFAPT